MCNLLDIFAATAPAFEIKKAKMAKDLLNKKALTAGIATLILQFL